MVDERVTAPVFVIGPTASGKSALALQLAQHFDAEIISMDSAQIYRGMDIGTAKPEASERAACPHHLLDICDPAESYSAARFAADASRLCREVIARGRLPLLVGGTFLYMRAMLQGLHEMPAADPQLRRQLEAEAAHCGWPALHQRLVALDPQAADAIHPNDAQRIQRALELALTGQARSDYWSQAREPVWFGPVLKMAVVPQDRDQLRADIAGRFQRMMKQGFLQEVRALHGRGDLHAGLPSMRSVGYRQLWQYLDGEIDLDQAQERGIIATRQYAKRQMTWLRREQDLMRLPQTQPARLDQALKQVQEFLASAAT